MDFCSASGGKFLMNMAGMAAGNEEVTDLYRASPCPESLSTFLEHQAPPLSKTPGEQ